MKFKFIIPVFALLASLVVSCDDSADNLGKEIQPTDDKIVLKADTFHLSTLSQTVDHIISRPDSMLLGTYIDDVLGTTRADLLTQLAIPSKEFTYLDPSVAITTPDSVIVNMSFYSYFGVTTSPIEISIYEMKKALSDKENYYSDINPAEYVDFSKKLNAKSELLTIKDGVSGTIQTSLSVKLSNEFLQRIFTTDPKNYKTQAGFQEFFKGLYVTTDFGSSAMINVSSLTMTLYYHYIYNNDPTKAKIKSYQAYHANSEVVKVNRVQHPFRNLNITPNDQYNILASPSNYQTKVRIPIGRMRQRVNVGDKRLDINSALLKLEVQDRASWAPNSIIPYVGNMLLIKEEALDAFFKEHKLPSDTVSFLASLGSESVTATTYKYNYSFSNMSAFLKNEFKKKNNAEYIDMVLLPVSVLSSSSSSSSTSTISAVVQATEMQAVSIFSGKHKETPIRMEVVYSGY